MSFMRLGIFLVLVICSTEVIAQNRSDIIGGSLAGQALSNSNWEVAVDPGTPLTGTVRLSVHNAHTIPSVVVPVGYTWTWGSRESAIVGVRSDVPPGDIVLDIDINLTAPSTNGVYYIIFAHRGEFTMSQVLSATNWQAGPVRWHDGNDYHDMTEEQLEFAHGSGYVPNWQYLFANGYSPISVAAAPIKVTVGPPLVTVPNVVGLAQAAAESAIISASLTVGLEPPENSDTVPAGYVISQNPSAETEVEEGSTVNLVISLPLGPPLVTVPNVVGLAQAAAESAIISASLAVGLVTTANSATVPAGDVISQSPGAGTEVEEGSLVNLDVSLGTLLVTVPNIVGLTEALAKAEITLADLTVGIITTENSGTVSVGDVIIQSPSAGTEVVAGSAVNLAVSLGSPPTITVKMLNFTPNTKDDNVARLHFEVEVQQAGQPVEGAQIFVSNLPDVSHGSTDASGKLASFLTILAPEIPIPHNEIVTAVIDGVRVNLSVEFYNVSEAVEPQEHKITLEEAFAYNFLDTNKFNPFIPSSGEDLGVVKWLVDAICIIKGCIPLGLPMHSGDKIGRSCSKYEVPGLSPTFFIHAVWSRGFTILSERFLWVENESECSFPPLDRNLLALQLESPAFLHVTSPDNQRAGYDPATQNPIFDFPAVFSNIGDEPFKLLIPAPAEGQYQVEVVGIGNGPYTLTIQTLDSDGIGGNEVSFTREISIGSIQSFTFEHNVLGNPVITMQVSIDIKPGSDVNSINLKSNGVIPVAILTTNGFDATTVDPLSVRFGPGSAMESHGKGHIEDADGDGDNDMVLHFRTQKTGIQCGDTEADLTGETVDGLLIEGSDSITVKCK